MTARGNKKEIYIIRANGSVDKIRSKRAESLLKFASENDGILAGDTIVVPIKSRIRPPLNMYRTVSQVVFQSIAKLRLQLLEQYSIKFMKAYKSSPYLSKYLYF